MGLSRRDILKTGVGIGVAAFLGRKPLTGRQQSPVIRKAIPSSGEQIPVIGLGSWRTFNLDPSTAEARDPRIVMRLFHEMGGVVIDTAPSYGRSEAFVGAVAQDLGMTDDLFFATKVNVGDRGLAAARAQMEHSSEVLHKRTVELMQVWNLGDNFRSLSDRYLDEHMDAVHEWKSRGRARYVGVTTSFPRQYDALESALRTHDMDFVQLDYSIGDRVPEERLLPLAMDRGIGVVVNRPFTSGNLFDRVRGTDLPGFASSIDCETWAQFFLKYIVSHPAVTCAIPATSDPEHLMDNMGACSGRLPDEAERRRMVEAFENL